MEGEKNLEKLNEFLIYWCFDESHTKLARQTFC